MVTGPAGECMDTFYADTRVRQISFSGSMETGREGILEYLEAKAISLAL